MICREGKRGIEEEEEGESDGEQGWGRVVVGRDTAVQWLYNIWESRQSILTKRKIIALFRLSTQKTRNLLHHHQVIMPSTDLQGEPFPNLLNLKDFHSICFRFRSDNETTVQHFLYAFNETPVTRLQHEHRHYQQNSLAFEVDLMSCFSRHPKRLHWNHYSATLVVVSYISFCFALRQTDGSEAANLCQTAPPATAEHSFTFVRDNVDKVSWNIINPAVLHA